MRVIHGRCGLNGLMGLFPCYISKLQRCDWEGSRPEQKGLCHSVKKEIVGQFVKPQQHHSYQQVWWKYQGLSDGVLQVQRHLFKEEAECMNISWVHNPSAAPSHIKMVWGILLLPWAEALMKGLRPEMLTHTLSLPHRWCLTCCIFSAIPVYIWDFQHLLFYWSSTWYIGFYQSGYWI